MSDALGTSGIQVEGWRIMLIGIVIPARFWRE
jgi:hypothetical protein